MKTKRLLTLLVLALVVATCLYLVGCGKCKHPELEITVVSKPTCTTDGVTNYVCSSCGYTETKTTPKLSQTGHNYVDGICTVCNFLAPSTSDLDFTLNVDGNSYTCTGIGSCASTQIFIGSCNNKPVTAIGYEAFKNCSNLTSVTLGNSVTSIYYGAFAQCSNLTSIVIPDSVTSIGDYAFYDCSNLTSIVIPNSVTSIGEVAFAKCSNLTSIVIPNSVTSIGEQAFCGCSNLTSVTIGNGVTSIGKYAFDSCDNLTSIKVATDNTNYCSQDGNLYNKDKTTLIQYACGKTATTFTIPDSVTHIEDWAFYDCSNLTSIVIPNSVTSIGDFAFYSCSNLTSVTLGNSITSIGRYAFEYCSNLTSIVMPNSVTTIGGSAFYNCDGLTSIVMPNSVTTIGDYAFCECDNLTIYCKATEKPDGWNSDWNYTKCPVYWAGQWHYDDNGNPTPNN